MNRNGSSNSTIILLVAAGCALLGGGFLLSLLTPLIFPTQASSAALEIDGLFRFMLVIGGAIFLLVEGMLIYSIIRFRRKANDDTDGANIHGNTVLEIVWTVIPSIIVTVLAIYAGIVWGNIRATQDNETVIYVTGQRFVWNFSYEFVDPRSSVQAAPMAIPVSNPAQSDEGEGEMQAGEAAEIVNPTFSATNLHVYAGQNVVLRMDALDVIHSFWVPALRIKQDLLPGRTTEIRFTPITPPEGFQQTFTVPETGAVYGFNQYRVVCAELCGGGHGQMYAFLIVWESEEAYQNAFYAPGVDRVLNPPADPVIFGQQILASGGIEGRAYACAGCHQLDALGWQGQTGPNLNGIGDRAANRVAGQSAYEYIFNSIYFPNQYLVPGFSANLMPHYAPEDTGDALYQPMPEVDHLAIVGYLCTQTASGESACEFPQDQFEPLFEEAYGGGDAEATPEAGAEMTPEATAEAESEATPEATAAAAP